ncbi:MAG: hypothetical protein IKO49_06520 [Bacilli bacterium]|nr:hypothetical protein [Bacilli bacterium]
MKQKSTVKPLMKTISPDINGITKIEIDWKDTYKELNKGTYRISKKKGFNTLYSEEFEIE